MAQRNAQSEYSIENLNSVGEVTTASDQLKLGIAYFQDYQHEDNSSIAFKWIKLSAEQGNMEAQFRLADLYSLGQGTFRSHTEAYKWYTKAAIQGCKKASIRINNLYQQDTKMHCRGKLNSEEVHRQREFDWYKMKVEHYYRELNEQRLEDDKLLLNHAVDYYTTKFEKYKESNQEDPEVQQKLGFLYQHGYGVKKYDKWAIEYYTKAADQGYTDSQYQLGCLYQKNTGIKFNNRKAFHWYRLAAEGGNIAAQNCLAYFYEKGLGTDIDYQTALSWYTKAAESGHSGAQLNLGKWYRKGEYVDQNYTKATKWYSLAARQGHSVAQNCLAQLYRTGKISPLIHVESMSENYICGSKKEDLCSKLRSDILKLDDLVLIKNMEKLAKRALVGDGNSMYQIGLKYYYGTDFAEDKYIGFKWIKKAADTGLEEGIFRVIKMYEEGDTVEQDYHKVAIWTKRVARTKNSKLLCDLGILYNEGRGMRNDPLEASKWFTLSAEQGNSEAQYQLGCLRQEGRGLRKNEKEALNLFELSAKQGNANGCYKFGLALSNDNEVENENKIEYGRTTINLLKYSAKSGSVLAQYKLWKIFYEKKSKFEADFYFDTVMLSDDVCVINKMVNNTLKYPIAFFGYINYFNLLKKAANLGISAAQNVFQQNFDTAFNFSYHKEFLKMFMVVSAKGISPMEYPLALIYDNRGINIREMRIEENPIKAIYWYDLSAKKGDTRAQVRLGILCEEGIFVEKNLTEAIKYYNLAYKKGNKDAMYRLACMYLDGRGVSQDLEKAFELFSQASDMDHKAARRVLLLPHNTMEEHSSEYRYYRQMAVEINDGNRMKMLEKMAESGSVAIQYQLGVFYEGKDDLKAVEWLTLAAQGGITDACYRLGVLYEKERDVGQDYMKAMSFYKKAIKNEHEDSMYRLAQMYIYGKGTEIDYKKAYELYSSAAKMGHVLSCNILDFNLISTESSSSEESKHLLLMLRHVAEEGDANLQYELGHFYESSLNEQNYKEAAKWYSMAVNNSHPEAMHRLGVLYETGSGVDRDYEKAIHLYNQACSRGNYDALYRLGTVYQYGVVTDISPERVIQCYTEAAMNGHIESQHALGKLCEKGIFIEKDILNALKWYTRSYLKGYDPARNELYASYDDIPYEMYFFVQRNRLLLSVANSLLFSDIGGYDESYGLILYKIGINYLFGNGITQDYAEAMKYFKESGKTWYRGPAQSILNLIYKGDRDIFLKAVDMYEALSDDLDSTQQRALGMLYYNGVLDTMEDNTFNLESMSGSTSGVASGHIVDKQNFVLSKNYRKAFLYLSKVTVDGDGYSEAQNKLAEMYTRGFGVTKNIQKVIEHYTKVYSEKNYFALEIARLYHFDNDFFDYSQAIKWYKCAVEDEKINTRATSLNMLGLIYKNGAGINQDYTEALSYFEMSASLNNEYASYNLGLMYYHGQGVEKNYSKAFEWFLTAVRNGHIKAEMYLADMHLNGYGVEKDIEQASKWYSKASTEYTMLLSITESENEIIWVADTRNLTLPTEIRSKVVEWCMKIQENDPIISLSSTEYIPGINFYDDNNDWDEDASSVSTDYSGSTANDKNRVKRVNHAHKKAHKVILNCVELAKGEFSYILGKMYYCGEGVEIDYYEAYNYFSKGSEKSNSGALYMLGEMYMKGQGVVQNTNRAIEFYIKAANNDDDVAPAVLGELYHFNNEIQDFSKALKWYKKTEGLDKSYALRGIGLLFEYGDGVEQDYEKSVGYYQQSIQLGNKGGCYNLAMMYYYGKGVDQNYKKCFKILDDCINLKLVSENTYVFVRTENTSLIIKIKENRLYSLENETTLYGEIYYQLGIMYKNGEGTDQNHEEAKKCFLKAADCGNKQAKEEL